MHVLQNEKRQLETAMVVESKILNKHRNVSRRSLPDTPDGQEQSDVRDNSHKCTTHEATQKFYDRQRKFCTFLSNVRFFQGHD